MRTGDPVAMNRAALGKVDPSSLPPSPGLPAVIVTCLDARTDPAHVLGLGAGQAAVIRSVGGRVTDRVLDELRALHGLAATMVDPGMRLDVAVMHHTMCGSMMFSDAGIRTQIAANGGLDESIVAEMAIADPNESIRVDCAALVAGLPAGTSVSGYLYTTESGRLDEVVATTTA